MQNLPERGPVVLWTGPDQYRLLAEIFDIGDSLVVMRAHWPEGGSGNPAQLIPKGIIGQEYEGPGPYYLWPLQDDDNVYLHEEWDEWQKVQDIPGHTRKDAWAVAKADLDLCGIRYKGGKQAGEV